MSVHPDIRPFLNRRWWALPCWAVVAAVTGWADPGLVTVRYDFTAQRFLGDESTLQRDKYFNIHADYMGAAYSAEDMEFLRELGIGLGRVFNGPFWYSHGEGTAPYPTDEQAAHLSTAQVDRTQTHPLWPYHTRRRVFTDHPKQAFSMDMDLEKAAQWTVSFFRHFFTDADRPAFYEPMNEPFVHAGEFGGDEEEVRERMTAMYREIGKAFDASGLDVEVVGYASAWPSMELWDFKHWRTRMKMFMDVAGEYMDGFSVHLYDGTNVAGQDNRRSGSNAEAILDLVETYSFIKWGRVKPHALTEYGDIPKGFGPEYSPARSAAELNAYNHLLFTFLERQDRIRISIPFITAKSHWFYSDPNNDFQPYLADLWRPDPDRIVDGEVDGFLLTQKVHFYRLWQGVAGTRAVAYTDDPDIRATAFVNGVITFLCLNNLEDEERTVRLAAFGDPIPGERRWIRRLYVPAKEPAQYVDQPLSEALRELVLRPHETIILTTETAAPVRPARQVRAITHYADRCVEPIVQEQLIDFTFTGIPGGAGRALLRLGLGRKHDRSKAPVLEVNGTRVPVPADWAGYDQANREDFFGAIEVPVPRDALRHETAVRLTFPDSGGHVSSVVLLTETDHSLPTD